MERREPTAATTARSLLAPIAFVLALAVYWLIFAPLAALFWRLAGDDG